MITCFTSDDSESFCISRISSRAPWKLVPLSEKMSAGHPRLAIKRSRVARNSLEDRDAQRSKCTALVVMQTKTTAYVFTKEGFLMCPTLIWNGPAKSTPVL